MLYFGVRWKVPPRWKSPEITARELLSDRPMPTPISAGRKRISRPHPGPAATWLMR